MQYVGVFFFLFFLLFAVVSVLSDRGVRWAQAVINFMIGGAK